MARDLTELFQSVVAVSPSQRPSSRTINGRPKRARSDAPYRSAFQQTTVYVSEQLTALTNHVNNFGKKSKNRSVFNKEVELEMATETERLQGEFQRIRDGLAAVDKIVKSGSMNGREGEHGQVVLKTLSLKFSRVWQCFRDMANERAKAITDKQTTLEKKFGGAGVRGGGRTPAAARSIDGSASFDRTRQGNQDGTEVNQKPGRLSTTEALLQMPTSTSLQQSSQQTVPRTKVQQPQFQGVRRAGVQPPRAAGGQLRQRRGGGIKPHEPEYRGPSFAPLPRSSQQQIQQQQGMVNQQGYMQQRGEEVQQIEKQLAQVSEVMIDFANLVQEQGQTIESINDHLSMTEVNVNKAREVLMDYYNSLTGDRGLIIKVFIVVIVISVLFLVLW